MYMSNTNNLHQGPNATYIPLARVGGFAPPNAKDTNIGIFALGDAKVPDASSFVSQWNIGFNFGKRVIKVL